MRARAEVEHDEPEKTRERLLYLISPIGAADRCGSSC